ncbi:MAG: hypothetical protein KatS3mg031_1100 [Chitinophagales bacterium]|nr:MAG: hypothetical protein KatS3mg031_1100 [Chitinophagales bacterium]
MELSGKVIAVLPLQSGNGRNGAWRKQDFILETNGKYPKKVCISMWGDRIDQFNIQEGQILTVSVEVESREYNGRWYTDVKAWKISADRSEDSPHETGTAPAPVNENPDTSDDLPF